MTLWTVKYSFSRLVDAPNKQEAYKQAVKAIKDDPESVISKIEPEGSGMTNRRLIKGIFFGF
jgi:hypothetical protein